MALILSNLLLPLLLLILVGLIGIIAGLIATLFGIGAGILLVPAIIYILGKSYYEAIAYSMFAIIILAGLGAREHYKHGNVNVSIGLLLGLCGIFGSIIGVTLTTYIEARWLLVFFGAILIFMVFRLLRRENKNTEQRLQQQQQQRGRQRVRTKRVQLKNVKMIILPTGFIAGIIGGLFGIGGGILMVPVLVLLVGFIIHHAIGTSLLAIVLIAVSSVATHTYYQHLTTAGILTICLPLAVGAVPGTKLGLWLTTQLSPIKLKRIFAIGLALIGIYTIVKGLGIY